MLLFPFLVITLFGAGFAMEKHELALLKTKEEEAQANNVYRYFRMILNELVEEIPELEKEKYSHIFFDFLGQRFYSVFWHVDVALDQATNAKFECKLHGTFKYCKLKTVNGVNFDGQVQLDFYTNKDGRYPRFTIHVQSLYVADNKPYVPGKLIMKLVKNMIDSVPDAIATLDDASNVKVLSLMTTGESYYEHLGFHYVHKDGTRMTKERKNFQKTEIDVMMFLNCVLEKLNQRMNMCAKSFLFDEHLKEGIVDALKVEVGSENRKLEDFWKIYRNVMKNVDFHAFQEKFKFDKHLQRYSKTYFFTQYFRECLQEQIITSEFSAFNRMKYP